MRLKDKFLIQTYNVGILKKAVDVVLAEGIKEKDIVWLKHPYKDRFFADPFVIDEDESNLYILVEEYCFWEEKGKIVLLTVNKDDFSLIERKLIIEEETHLSFPFCELGGNSIIPESVISGETKQYFYDREKKTIVRSERILDEGLIDAAFYKDKKGTEWILTSKKEKPKEDLYIYKKVGNNYICQNNGKPVLSDIRLTRSAGRLFEHDGRIFRPVQDSTGRYGRQTIIVELQKLEDHSYQTREVVAINSVNNPPYDETLHTFNVYENYIIVDGSKDILRFPTKILYKKCRFLFKNRI